MDESIEGSPGAARSAQPEDRTESDETGGFFRRVIGIFNPHDEEDASDAAPGDTGAAVFGVDRLRHVTVEDVAIPTAEIVAVPVDITLTDLVQVFRESGMSRLPVFEGTLDTPLGMIHLKDFALKHGFNGKGTRLDIHSMLRPLLYVPPSMPIGVLMQKMQAERRHMALVIDEYGGVDGLVTIEDLIEQVVGEIEDEHDTDDDAYWQKEAPGCYLAVARTPLDEFEAEIGLSLTETDEVDEEEIDTLGGLVFMLLGRVPARGEVIEHPTGASLEVVEADPRRIKRVRVRVPGLAGE
ncbi:MAG: transporter associated domain-containing protein [Roseovarius sp.]|nr:transporter associated domain-containing protein [Roseovarius sp.]